MNWVTVAQTAGLLAIGFTAVSGVGLYRMHRAGRLTWGSKPEPEHPSPFVSFTTTQAGVYTITRGAEGGPPIVTGPDGEPVPVDAWQSWTSGGAV